MKISDILVESFTDAKRIFSQSEDNDTVEKYLNTFKDLAKRNIITGQEKDISYWIKQGWDSFKELVDNKKEVQSKSQTKKSKKKDSIVVHEDSDKMVVVPLTKDASCYYGKQTKWCTAATQGENHFEHYFFDNSIILFYVLKKDGNKYAAAYSPDSEKFELFDSHDKHMTESEFTAQSGVNTSLLKEWYFKNKNIKEKANLYKKREYERKLIKNKVPKDIYMYAYSIKKPFPEGEDIIATSPEYSFEYAKDVLKAPFPKGEDAISTEANYSYLYAKDVLGDSFPKGEHAIASKPYYIRNYIYDVLKTLTPSFEQVILNDPEAAYTVSEMLTKPYEKIENVLATSATYSYKYALNVIEDRFIKGEDILKTDSKLLTQYVIKIIKERIPEFEPHIADTKHNDDDVFVDVTGYGIVNHIFSYIEFLKKNYSEKELNEFFVHVSENIPEFIRYIIKMMKFNNDNDISTNFSTIKDNLKFYYEHVKPTPQDVYDLFILLDNGEEIFTIVPFNMFSDKSKFIFVKKNPKVLEIVNDLPESFIDKLVKNKANEYNIDMDALNIKDKNLLKVIRQNNSQ